MREQVLDAHSGNLPPAPSSDYLPSAKSTVGARTERAVAIYAAILSILAERDGVPISSLEKSAVSERADRIQAGEVEVELKLEDFQNDYVGIARTINDGA